MRLTDPHLKPPANTPISAQVQAAGGWTSVPTSYRQVAAQVESVQGWLLQGQEQMLFDIVRSLPDDAVILELGAFMGRSTCAMAFGCMGTRKRILSVDTFGGNDGMMGKSHNDLYPKWLGNLQRFGLESYATGIRGWSHEVLKDWHRRPRVDFVFIDASHEYLDVLRDFEMIHPYVKDNGWIAFHDVEINWPGPWRIWESCAKPILADHRYSSTLAAGRKLPGMRIAGKGLFSFSESLAAEIDRNHPSLQSLAAAMRVSLADRDLKPTGPEELSRAEAAIAAMPKNYQDTVSFIVRMDGSMDGMLHYWWALVLLQQSRAAEALDALERAGQVSFAAPAARIALHRRKAEAILRSGSAAAAPTDVEAIQTYSLKAPAEYDWWDRRKSLRRGAHADFFRTQVPATAHAIEFGCGEGHLLKSLRCRAKIGLETDHASRKIASLNFGLETFADPSLIPEGWAHIILGNHVLEIQPSPLETLKSLKTLLAPGGRMAFTVAWGRARLPYRTLEQETGLYRWDPQSLGNLFRAAGLSVLEVESGTLDLPADCLEPGSSEAGSGPEEDVIRILAAKA